MQELLLLDHPTRQSLPCAPVRVMLLKLHAPPWAELLDAHETSLRAQQK